jgi:mannosyltransferase
MAVVASRRAPLPGVWERLARLPFPVLAIAGLLALCMLSLALRWISLGDSFWMDEALSVGIASHPLGDIPGILRIDGSPPLYYAVLHVWMSLVGDGTQATQALSLGIAMLTIPAALWSGWSLFGRRVGLICAALAALNPFITLYANETRMYALIIFLSVLATATFVHAFVYRRRIYIPAFAVLLAAMFYTHNWGLFFAVGCAAALIPCLLGAAERRPLFRDAVLGFGGAGLLFAPWLPTLAYQASHTGAPWLNPPRFGAPLQISKTMLGGGVGTALLLFGSGSGLVTLRSRESRSPERTAALALLVIAVGTLAVAWLVSRVSPAWTTRYLGVILGPLIPLAALGFARAGRVGLVTLALMLVFWAIPHSYDPKNKSNASDLAASLYGKLRPGDLVITTQPEQTPLMRYWLGPRLRYATVLGPVKDPGVMDWDNGLERMEASTPAKDLEPLLARLPRRSRVLLVRPATLSVDDWDAPWTRLIRRRSAQWGQALSRNKRFVRGAVVPEFYRPATRIGVRGVLYEPKTR